MSSNLGAHPPPPLLIISSSNQKQNPKPQASCAPLVSCIHCLGIALLFLFCTCSCVGFLLFSMQVLPPSSSPTLPPFRPLISTPHLFFFSVHIQRRCAQPFLLTATTTSSSCVCYRCKSFHQQRPRASPRRASRRKRSLRERRRKVLLLLILLLQLTMSAMQPQLLFAAASAAKLKASFLMNP